MPENYEDRLLARWLEGRLSAEELAELRNSEAYADYLAIVNGMDRFKKPGFDGISLSEQLMTATGNTASSKVRTLKPWHYIAAAMIAVLIALGVLFSEKTYTTGLGEQLAIILPDGSQVQLNAQSHLKHRRYFWTSDRTFRLLEGEAYFEVTDGDHFNVSTTFGTVRVLGTKFNIRSRNQDFDLDCYEGKVQFEADQTGEQLLLSGGESLHRENGGFVRDSLPSKAPSWISGRSEFKDVSLARVLQEMEIQYGLTFETASIDTAARFTGGFVHNDLMTALKSVMLPMGIAYEVNPGQQTVILRPENNLQE